MAFEIKGRDSQEVQGKMSILADIQCEIMIGCRHESKNEPGKITRTQWYREYCEYVFKICGESYKLYPPSLINGTLTDVLIEYKSRCADIHINPNNYTGDLADICNEIHATYGESFNLPPSNITKWTYEKLAHWYIANLPYYELVGVGI